MSDWFGGWQKTIATASDELFLILEQSPILKTYFIDRFNRNFTIALTRTGNFLMRGSLAEIL